MTSEGAVELALHAERVEKARQAWDDAVVARDRTILRLRAEGASLRQLATFSHLPLTTVARLCAEAAR